LTLCSYAAIGRGDLHSALIGLVIQFLLYLGISWRVREKTGVRYNPFSIVNFGLPQQALFKGPGMGIDGRRREIE